LADVAVAIADGGTRIKDVDALGDQKDQKELFGPGGLGPVRVADLEEGSRRSAARACCGAGARLEADQGTARADPSVQDGGGGLDDWRTAPSRRHTATPAGRRRGCARRGPSL
jgi:hypothetical protein